MAVNNYPKFDKKINEFIDNKRFTQTRTRPGVVISFDKKKNTANILLEDKMSGDIGNILREVPCPDTQGVQTVAPLAGARCMVGFRDDNERYPYIVSFINDINYQAKNRVHYSVETGIPNFLI